MAIVFKVIRWKNLLSTGNSWTEVQLNKSKTTLIVGENGAGKSTILDAISFALYGRPFRKINKPQLVNSINRKGLVTEIEFQISKRQYKIIRGISPGIFEIWQDGTMLPQDASVRDYQDILEKSILKLNHKSFSQVIVLGTSNYLPFMQLSPASRRQVIEDLLDIEIFSIMNTLLKDRVYYGKVDRKELTHNIISAKDKVVIHKQHLKEIKKSKDKLIEDNQEKIDVACDKITVFEKSLGITKKEAEKLTGSIVDHDKVKRLQKKYVDINKQLLKKVSNLKKEIKFLEDNVNCPTCNQDIDQGFREESVVNKEEKISKVDAGIIELDKRMIDTSMRLWEISAQQGIINDLQTEMLDFNSKIRIQQSVIDHARNDNDKYVKDRGDIKEKEKQIKGLRQDLTRLEREMKENSHMMETLSAAAYLLKDGGIKARIIRQYIPVMNRLVNKYLAAMDFYVKFEIDESFHETIKSRYRDDFSYHSFSEGEKLRIDVALLFTWRAVAKLRNSVSTNLLIMDEVLDASLDATGTDDFMKILGNIASDSNVFIISHKTDALQDKFHDVIKFEKNKNFSRIVT